MMSVPHSVRKGPLLGNILSSWCWYDPQRGEQQFSPPSATQHISNMSAIHQRRLTPIDTHQQATFKTSSLEHDKMSTLLRLFVRIEANGCPSFEIAAPPGVLHYLFPPGSPPGMETCQFFIEHIPTNRHELVADLSSVLNTRQLKPNEDHFRILPTAAFVRERMAQQTAVYPPPSIHPTHLRLAKNRADQDPEVADLPGYRTILLFPADVSSYLVAMGFRYIGSHVEACGARGPPGEIWDIHTFVGGEKLTMLLTKLASMSASPQSQTSTYEENVGTPRVGPRVTFREEDCKSWFFDSLGLLRII
jgi:hypothetical protein